MQVIAVFCKRFNRDQFLTIECRQKLNARIDRVQTNVIAVAIQFREDHRARTAITLGATFLGPGSAQILAKELQHGPCRIDA